MNGIRAIALCKFSVCEMLTENFLMARLLGFRKPFGDHLGSTEIGGRDAFEKGDRTTVESASPERPSVSKNP
ncbi:MAG: hypothetical protein IGR76_16125 [Synechococcales cyanobacterium T60_A2020_003]|nr:hypothetical protein [Synechococcales cyanobacterium T60_A2020_003]